MNRIAALRKERKLSQKELGTIIGVAQNTICNWENGKREPDYESLKKLAFFFDCSTDYLLGTVSFGRTFVADIKTDKEIDWAGRLQSQNMQEKKSVSKIEHAGPGGVRIPVLGSVPSGIPIGAIEDILDWEEIPASMCSGDREYFALQVQGDSMWPDYLTGDVVIIRKTPCCESGDDCVVYINGYDATLKQVKLGEDGSLSIIPRNPNYPPKTYTAKEVQNLPVSIAGVVVELRRKVGRG